MDEHNSNKQGSVAQTAPQADCLAWLHSMMTEFEAPLLRYVGKMIGTSYDEAQDIVQDVFIRAYRHIESKGLDSIDNPRCWLYRVAHNLAMDAGRRRGRQKKAREKVMMDPTLRQSITPQATDAHSAMARGETCKLAMQALEQLPEEQRSVVLLKIIQGMTLKQISAVTGLKIGTVNYRLTQALQTISRQLKTIDAI